jgi:DNA polymerase/3'-5' exonuclease PolX
MENREIVRLLYETADLMEIAAEDLFGIGSYRTRRPLSKAIPKVSPTSSAIPSAR